MTLVLLCSSKLFVLTSPVICSLSRKTIAKPQSVPYMIVMMGAFMAPNLPKRSIVKFEPTLLGLAAIQFLSTLIRNCESNSSLKIRCSLRGKSRCPFRNLNGATDHFLFDNIFDRHHCALGCFCC